MRVMISRIAGILVLTAVTALNLLASPPEPSAQIDFRKGFRSHFELVNVGDVVEYQVTRELSEGPHTLTAQLGIKSRSGSVYTVERTMDFESGTERWQLTPHGDDRPLTVLTRFPFSSQTADEFLSKARGSEEFDVTVEVRGDSVATATIGSTDTTPPSHQASFRRSVSDAHVQILQDLQPLLSMPPMMGACRAFAVILGEQYCDPAPAFSLRTAPPSCAFDQSVQMPCDSERKANLKALLRSGTFVGPY